MVLVAVGLVEGSDVTETAASARAISAKKAVANGLAPTPRTKVLSVNRAEMKAIPVKLIEATPEATPVATLVATPVALETGSAKAPSVVRTQTTRQDSGHPVVDRPRASGLIGPITLDKLLVRLDD